jgi:hypothetical protein
MGSPLADYRAALAAVDRARLALRAAIVDAETAAALLCDSRAARCDELARLADDARQQAEKIVFALGADLSSLEHQNEWSDEYARRGRHGGCCRPNTH